MQKELSYKESNKNHFEKDFSVKTILNMSIVSLSDSNIYKQISMKIHCMTDDFCRKKFVKELDI